MPAETMHGITRAIQEYIAKLGVIKNLNDATEHSFRTDFHNLLHAFWPEEDGYTLRHEPRQEEGSAPDFILWQRGVRLGFIECKKPGENLEQIAQTRQIRKYAELCSNILLTDYLQLFWLRDGAIIERVGVQQERFHSILEHFASTPPQGISQASKLAEALAIRSRILKQTIGNDLGSSQCNRLSGLYDSLKELVAPELSHEEFVDTLAQMLPYSLLMARLNQRNGQPLTLFNISQHVPGNVLLLRELVRFLEDIQNGKASRIRWVIEEILAIINTMERVAILEQLSFINRRSAYRSLASCDEEEWRLFSRDPFIYFYEDFLRLYDEQLRAERGVYYTPPPVVSYIIKAVDRILEEDFQLADGLADHRWVTLLDFACGTGTFLVEVFNIILERTGAAKAQMIADEHLLKNIYGFELLIAPYVVAHMKLSQFLAERGISIRPDERIGVYLTNTLEQMETDACLPLMPALTEESRMASAIKSRPILVITGNPPYSVVSKNSGSWITQKIDDYKKIGRQEIREANLKSLQDDYVKFIRFAQDKMDRVNEGIVAVITNHAWLKNPTFRGMRDSLLNSFDQIRIIDLHGNSRRRETAPDGGRDQNVFDIQQGVAIAIFIKKQGLEKGVFHQDLWGDRARKYRWLVEADAGANQGIRLEPKANEWCLFKPIKLAEWQKYHAG